MNLNLTLLRAVVETYNAALKAQKFIQWSAEASLQDDALQSATAHLISVALADCTPYELTNDPDTGLLNGVIFAPDTKHEWTLVFAEL